jgi:hypothetical protein
MKLEIHFEFRASLRNFQDLNFGMLQNITNSILYSSSQIESLRRYLFACWPAAERSVFAKSQSQTERHQWLRPLLLSSWNGLSPSSPLDHTCSRMGMSAAYRHHTLAHMEAFQFFSLGN